MLNTKTASLLIVDELALHSPQCQEEAQNLELERAYNLVGNWIRSMIPLVSGWVYSRFVPLALLQIFLWLRILCAQLPERVERCLPYPTLAQEIRAMKEETEPTQPQPPRINRTIISVRFSPETHLPQTFRTQIARSIKSHHFYDDSLSDWLKELQEVGVRGQLQDLGFFRPNVEADAHFIDGNLRNRRYSLTLRIEEGRQYRLGEIRGIDLVMKLDEEKPYRVGKIEFLGLNENTQSQLTPKLNPGDVFDRNLVDEIFKRNKSLLPPDASWKDVSVHRNTKEGTVDIRFDFWTCPRFEYYTPSVSVDD